MAAGTKQSGNRLFLQGCKDKSGKPYIGRYLKDVPNPVPEGWVLDTTISKKGKVTNFQRFDFVSGFLKNIFSEVEEIEGKKVTKLFIILADETQSYQIDLGALSGGYARQFLQRVISPSLNPDDEMQVELYSYNKSDGTLGTALSLKQGGENIKVKDENQSFLPFISAMPDGVKLVVNNQNITDYTAQINWLMVTAKTGLPADLFVRKAQQAQQAPVATSAPQTPPIQVNVPVAPTPPPPPPPIPDQSGDELPF